MERSCSSLVDRGSWQGISATVGSPCCCYYCCYWQDMVASDGDSDGDGKGNDNLYLDDSSSSRATI